MFTHGVSASKLCHIETEIFRFLATNHTPIIYGCARMVAFSSQKRKHDSSDDSRASTPSDNTFDSRPKRLKLPTEGSSNQPQQKNHQCPQRSNFRRQPLAHNGYRQPWTGPAPSNAYPKVFSAQPNIPYQPQMSNIPPMYAHSYGYPRGFAAIEQKLIMLLVTYCSPCPLPIHPDTRPQGCV